MRPAIYARADDKAEWNRQLNICRGYLSDNDIEPEAEIIDDGDTYPGAIDDLVQGVKRPGDDLTHVVAPRVRTFGASYRDAVEVVEELVGAGVEVQAVRDGVTVEDDEDLRLLKLAAEAERHAAERETASNPARWSDERWTGRPPLGCTTDDQGRLAPITDETSRDNFDAVSKALRDVVNQDATIYEAAGRVGASRTTIKTAIRQRSGLYDGLTDDATLPSDRDG